MASIFERPRDRGPIGALHPNREGKHIEFGWRQAADNKQAETEPPTQDQAGQAEGNLATSQILREGRAMLVVPDVIYPNKTVGLTPKGRWGYMDFGPSNRIDGDIIGSHSESPTPLGQQPEPSPRAERQLGQSFAVSRGTV